MDDSSPDQDVSGEIFEEIVVPELDDGFDRPLISVDQLARLLGSGLTPRNVDAAGRGLQAYNNVLADTIFERHPLRQFQPVEVDPAEVEANSSDPVEDSVAEPVRGLWSKNAPIGDAEASEFVEEAIQPLVMAEADSAVKMPHASLLQFSGVVLSEDNSLTVQYAQRDGWRGWFRGFGGNDRAYASTTIANDYSLYTGGFVVGADLALSESFQLGGYVNYGDVDVVQRGDTGGGDWSPDGWGGGLTADYWTENFYVQGLFGASGFSGTQERGIVSIADGWGDVSARGEKSASTWLGALRIGAPFQVGKTLLEPQLTGIWTQNQEESFSESGVRDALRLSYRKRTTNYLQTGLGLKAAWPIKSCKRAQWVPSVKVAWLSDWDLGNGEQTIGYRSTDREVGFKPEQENQNGALIEAGLDYSVANLNATSFKLYAKGGVEIWGGDRGTSWRASGGVTFQF